MQANAPAKPRPVPAGSSIMPNAQDYQAMRPFQANHLRQALEEGASSLRRCVASRAPGHPATTRLARNLGGRLDGEWLRLVIPACFRRE